MSHLQVEVRNKAGELAARITNLDAIQFLRTLPNSSVDVIITDPAYSGMNQHLSLGKGRIVGTYSADKSDKWFEEFHDTPENYGEFLQECKRVLRDDRHIFIMFDSYSMITLGPIFREVFNLKNILTWDKVSIGMGHYYRRRSEFILFGSKGKRPLTRRDIPDIWRLKRIHNPQYPTQKPVEVFQAMIASSFKKDEKFTACDPFTGSGSSGVATIKLGGVFLGNDVSSKSVHLIQERLQGVVDSEIDILQAKSALVADGIKDFWND